MKKVKINSRPGEIVFISDSKLSDPAGKESCGF